MKSYIIIFFSMFFTTIFAQQKIDTVKIINNGILNMEIDSSIYNILKTREGATCAYNTPTKPTVDKKSNNRSSDPCYNNALINGFKIQIFYSKNRDEANKIKEEFNEIYPYISAQVTYFSPDYRVLVGDYVTKNSASYDIRRLKSRYNNAFSIPFKVLCRKAK